MKKLFEPRVPKDISYIEEIIQSGNIMDTRFSSNFEEQLKKYLNIEYLLSCSSYENALWMGLKVAGLVSGDEVIASPLSCLASSQPLLEYNLNINWCDINPNYGVPGLHEIQSYVTENTKAVIYNSFCGYALELEEIYAFCKKKDILLIIDAIEGFGSKYKGKYLGSSYCDVAIYNFHTVRTLNAIEAGAVKVNDLSSLKALELLRDYGIDRMRFRTDKGEISNKLDITINGRGAKLNAINACIGIQNLKSIGSDLIITKDNILKWKENKLIKQNTRIKPVSTSEFLDHNGWIFGILCENSDEVKRKFDKRGIQTSKIHFPNNNYSIFPKKKLLGIENFYKKFLALPSGPHFSHD